MTEVQKARIDEYLKVLKKDTPLYETACRLTENKTVGFEQAVYDTVFAPALVCFISWVLEEARSRGIKRLYFLARDGYQMYLTAEALCKSTGSQIECRYLYGSRYAWRVPQFAADGEACLEKICLGGIDVTFEKVMRRGSLTEEEAWSVAKELQFENDYQTALSYGEVQRLKHPLQESELFLPYVYAHSEKAREAALEYLRQEGLFEEIPYALVDSGWTGSMQQTLGSLLQDAGYEKSMEGFYFGLYELPAKKNKNTYHAYYFGPKRGLKRKVYFSNCLYEAVYSAPHGMTYGYREEDGRYVPVFQQETGLNREKMQQEEAWLRAFLAEYMRHTGIGLHAPEETVTRRMVYRLFRKLMGVPTKDEVEKYGTFLFSDDVTEEYAQEVAATLTEEEIRNQRFLNKARIMLGLKKGELHDSAWPEGSIVKNGSRVKQGLRHAALYKYILYIRKALKSEE